MVKTDVETAANAALDEVIAGMGADVCIWSVDIAIDQIATELGADAAEQARVRALLRRRFDLAL